MIDPAVADFERTVERQRIGTLFERLPSSLGSVMVGILLVFVFFLPTTDADLIKAWAAFMLTTLAVRGWIWYMFRNSAPSPAGARRWEWAYAFGMALTGIWWSTLNGPLYPAGGQLQGLVMIMTVIVSFAGMIYSSVSHVAFLLFVLPTLSSAMARYIAVSNASVESIAGVAGCVLVMIMIHRTLNKFAVLLIRRQVESESLLAEQQAIFQTTTMGIAVISSQGIVKCNQRLGQLFGRSLQDLQTLPLTALFANQSEAGDFIQKSAAAFDAGKSMLSIHRMHRSDGSDFWGELSGRQMQGDETGRSVWLIADVTMRVSRERQAS